MKIKIIFLFVFIYLHEGFSLAQETRQKFLGIETGMAFFESEMSNMDYVRGDIPSYNEGYSANSITSLMYKMFIGIKPEIFSLNNKLGFSGGIRFSSINSSVGKESYWSNSTNYFYWRYRQDGVNTEYLKVKEINQTSYYIGIPLEIRYFPYRPRLFRLYFKLGAEINYIMQTKTGVVFYDAAMNSYQSDVAAKAGKPKSFSTSAYGAAGFRIGRESKPSISIEMWLPYLFLTSESSGLVKPIFSDGGGVQLNIQIPFKSKVQ